MKRNILIIEITERYLKILRSRRLANNEPQVVSFTALKIENAARDTVIRLLASVITAQDKKAEVIAVVPRNQVILKNFSLPSQSREELKKMIMLQMTTQLPYAKEDIVFDYVLLGADQGGFTKVLSAVIHKDVVEEFLKIFKAAGITAERFVLSSSSIARWFFRKLPEAFKKEKITFVVLNLEAATSEICFIKDGELTYSREIKYGRRDLGGDFEDAFLKEMVLTLEAYAKEHPAERTDKFYVLTTPQNKYPLFEKLRAVRNIDIQFIDPAGNLPDITAAVGKGGDFVSPVVCLGAAAESQKVSFNLLPEETLRRQAVKVRQRQTAVLFVLAAVNIVLFFFLFAQEFYQNQRALNDLQARSSDMRARAEGVEQKIQKLRQIEHAVNPSVSAVDIVYSLYDMTPREVSFQLLNVDRNDVLTVQGIAETRASVNDFYRNLVANPFLKDVNLQYAAQRKFFEGEITDFKITANIKRTKEQP